MSRLPFGLSLAASLLVLAAGNESALGGAGGATASSSSSTGGAGTGGGSGAGGAHCVDDGVCNLATEDCSCTDCVPTAFCTPGCKNDGVCDLYDLCTCPDCRDDVHCSDPASCIPNLCDEFLEGCGCAACAGVPNCQLDGGSVSATAVGTTTSTNATYGLVTVTGAGGASPGASGGCSVGGRAADESVVVVFVVVAGLAATRRRRRHAQ